MFVAFLSDLYHISSQRMFQILGFSEEGNGNELVLSPPNVHESHATGHVMRRKLLRAWVETGAYLEYFRKRYRKPSYYVSVSLTTSNL